MEAPFSKFNQLIEEAQRTNTERSVGERAAGFAAPEDCPVVVHFRTAKEAIQAGLVCEDWNAIAEGFLILRDVEKRLNHDD